MDTLEKHTDPPLSDCLQTRSWHDPYTCVYQVPIKYSTDLKKATAGREIDYANKGLLNYSGLGNIKQQLQAAIMKIVRIRSQLMGLNKLRRLSGKGQGKL